MLRLLMVEDTEDDALLILRELRRGGFVVESLRVCTANDLHEALAARTYDLVLSDYSMPSFTGIDALGIVRAEHADLPFIMVSGTIGEETAVEALRAGADDFLVKGRFARLLPAIDRALRDAADRKHRRSAEAAAEEAIRARLIAEAQSRTKSEFVAHVCHELRTPLNAILGFSELLEQGVDGELTPGQREHVQHVLESGKHLLSVINDILDVSKIEAGRMTLHPEPISLTAVVDRLRGTLRPILERRALSLTVAIPDGLPLLSADPVRLRQILLNLLSNACKFTPPGGSLALAARELDGRVEIDVQDDGIGLRQEDMPRLFRAYEQIGTGEASELGGTGLGLALTRKLVEMHGGAIRVQSRFGEGSTFTVDLPLPPEPLPPPQPARTREPRSAPIARALCVLVVEDDAFSMTLAKIILERRGHRVMPATSLAEARGALAADRPDVVLTDRQLPDGDGEELLLEIRRDPHLASIPVVIVTGDAMFGVREELLALGFDGYLTKPIDASTFASTIEAYIALRGSMPPSNGST